jgi:hypothetical protein
MRTTVDLPDDLFRRTKALAAMRGDSLKDVLVRAVEREVNRMAPDQGGAGNRARLPLIRLRHSRKLDLTGFDFDDLLA